MNNLRKVANIWNDLENSFKSSGISSRLEYIQKLIGFDNGTDKSSYILDKLKEEAPTYKGKDLELYSNIVGKIESSSTLLAESGLKKINNFEEFLDYASKVSTKLKNSNKLTDDLMDLLDFEYSKPKLNNTLETALDEIYNQVKGFGDVTKLVDGEVITLTLQDENACILYTTTVLANLIERYETDKFSKDIVNICAYLSEEGKLEMNQLFISSKYFKIEDKNINVQIGELNNTSKIYNYNKIKNNDTVGYIVNLKTEYGTIKIICVD